MSQDAAAKPMDKTVPVRDCLNGTADSTFSKYLVRFPEEFTVADLANTTETTFREDLGNQTLGSVKDSVVAAIEALYSVVFKQGA